MAYIKQTFEDYQILTSDNMNHIEEGLDSAHRALETKQNTLVSGTNIKTINGQSILGTGNLSVEGGSTGSSSINYATDYIQITEDEVTSVDIPESVRDYSLLMVYHNGSFLVKTYHYNIENNRIVFLNFVAFQNDVFAFVGIN